MQYHGLQKILTLISTDPSDLIIGRYVSLVKDMQNDWEKARSLLDLSKILLDIDPQEALKYALTVFEHNQSIEALQIIYQAVLSLGKEDKALVIKKEIERLKKIEAKKQNSSYKRASGSDLRSTTTTTTTTTNITSNTDLNTTRTITDEDLSSLNDTVLLEANNNQANDRISMIQSGPTDPSSKNSSQFEAQSSMKDTLSTHLGSSNSIPPRIDPSQINTNSRLEPNNNPSSLSSSVSMPSISTSSIHSDSDQLGASTKEKKDSVEAVLIELFDFYWKSNFLQEARSLLLGCRESYETAPWWLARMSLVESLPSDNGSGSNLSASQSIKLQLEKIKSLSSNNNRYSSLNNNDTDNYDNNDTDNEQDPFWSYLNILIKENNNRKALAHIREELKSVPFRDHSLKWAKKLYPKLNLILSNLEYKKISWNYEKENETSLYNRILDFIPQKLSSIII